MEHDLDALQALPADWESSSLLNTTETCGGPTCGTGSTCGGPTCTVSNEAAGEGRRNTAGVPPRPRGRPRRRSPAEIPAGDPRGRRRGHPRGREKEGRER
jgi:hypothetical protein